MVRMKLIAPLLLLVLTIPAMAQVPDPSLVGDTLAPVQDNVFAAAIPGAEGATGDDLTNEEFHISADIAATNIDYQIVNILFGGGKVQADLKGTLGLEFYAVKMERLDDAIRAAAGNDNVSLSDTFGVPTHRTALTAEEIRLIGAGELLAAFQTQQENLATKYVTDMLPGLRILELQVEWSNTDPVSEVTGIPYDPTGYDPGIPSIRDPPIILEVRVDLQYLDRIALYDILHGLATSNATGDAETDPEDPNAALTQEIRDAQSLPFIQRGAFEVLGIGQLLALNLEPGWTLDVAFSVPKGFTIEAVTDSLERSEDKQTAHIFLDGNELSEDTSDAGIVTMSNRFLVTSILSVSILLIGAILRAVAELGTLTYIRRKHRKEVNAALNA